MGGGGKCSWPLLGQKSSWILAQTWVRSPILSLLRAELFSANTDLLTGRLYKTEHKVSLHQGCVRGLLNVVHLLRYVILFSAFSILLLCAISHPSSEPSLRRVMECLGNCGPVTLKSCCPPAAGLTDAEQSVHPMEVVLSFFSCRFLRRRQIGKVF